MHNKLILRAHFACKFYKINRITAQWTRSNIEQTHDMPKAALIRAHPLEPSSGECDERDTAFKTVDDFAKWQFCTNKNHFTFFCIWNNFSVYSGNAKSRWRNRRRRKKEIAGTMQEYESCQFYETYAPKSITLRRRVFCWWTLETREKPAYTCTHRRIHTHFSCQMPTFTRSSCLSHSFNGRIIFHIIYYNRAHFKQTIKIPCSNGCVWGDGCKNGVRMIRAVAVASFYRHSM